MPGNRPESVLVYVGVDRVGDGLLKLPFVRAIKMLAPDCRLTWLAGKGNSAFAGVLKPVADDLIDEVIEFGDVGNGLRDFFRRPLDGRSFGWVIDTQRSAFIALALRRIPHDVFVSPAAGFRFSTARPPADYRRPESMLRQMMDLLEMASGEKLPTPAYLEIDIPDRHREAAARLLPGGPVYVGLAPGAGGAEKCWPLDRYIELGRSLAAKGRTPVFILGTMEDDWAQDIGARVPEALFPVQTGSLSDEERLDPLLTTALAARLKAAVANDSGLGHMLSAGDMPLISLFGATPPEKFPPLARELTIIEARDFGGRDMSAIPVSAVEEALTPYV